MSWAGGIRHKVTNQNTGGTSSSNEENIARIIYRMIRQFKSYRLEDFWSDNFVTPQFFQLCYLIQIEDKEYKTAEKKASKKK